MPQSPQRRRRGVVLTSIGLERLRAAIQDSEAQDNQDERYTLQDLSDRTQLDAKTIAKVLDGAVGLDKRTLTQCFETFALTLQAEDFRRPESAPAQPSTAPPTQQIDLGDAVDISSFYGRIQELATLSQWLGTERCRLVGLLGIGGIGKTALSVKLVKHLQADYDAVVWRSLRHGPPIEDLLIDLLQSLKPGTTTINQLQSLLSRLMTYLRQHRCLLVLDNWETLLASGAGSAHAHAGQHKPEYEGYGELLRSLGETPHQSCLILTSREKPATLAELEGPVVRALALHGLEPEKAIPLLTQKGLSGDPTAFQQLIQFYEGHPLGLKIVATAIQDIFAGDIQAFLDEGITVFNGLRILLDQQFQRLSLLEQDVMYWLAINRDPVTLAELRQDLLFPVPLPNLLEAMEALRRRSLCVVTQSGGEVGVPQFTLQPVLMEYVTQRFIEMIRQNFVDPDLTVPPNAGPLAYFHSHALLKAQTKEGVRLQQRQFILQPVLNQLLVEFQTPSAIESRLRAILLQLKQRTGYAAGNCLNLLVQLQVDLAGLDLSELALWQADLRDTALLKVNMAGADLKGTAFANAFPQVVTAAFNPQGDQLATGHFANMIFLWDVRNPKQRRQAVGMLQGHTNNVWSVAFHPDGTRLASGSEDQTIRLWQVDTEQCLRIFTGHTDCVRSVALHPDGQRLLSAGEDRTWRVWDLATGDCLQAVEGHEQGIWSIALSPNGQILASASHDATVKLWNVETGQCLWTLKGHTDWLRSVAFSGDGQWLVSGGCDRTLRIWKVSSGQCIQVLQPHSQAIFAVSFLPHSSTIVSAGLDCTICLTDLDTGVCQRRLLGHTSCIYALACHPQGHLLASGGDEPMIGLWDVGGQALQIWRAQVNSILSLRYSPGGQTLVSSSTDGAVRFWQVETQEYKTYWQHQGWVFGLAFHPQGNLVASAGSDQLIRLWDVASGSVIQVLMGHRATISALEFSPDGQQLASCSWDGTWRIWDLSTGQDVQVMPGHFLNSVSWSPDGRQVVLGSFEAAVQIWDVPSASLTKTLVGHRFWAWYVAWSPRCDRIVSGGADQAVRVWDAESGECLQVLNGHRDWVMGVAFSPNGQTLASCSKDGTTRLWAVESGQCLAELTGHVSWVTALAFSPDGQTLATASSELELKLWHPEQQECLNTRRADRLYEGLNLANCQGLTLPQQEMLKFLGATHNVSG
ncbi:WD40 repeat domain-containing protein [Acaryochloris sp. IP29b_bin.137]|uniref:WD40 repeat domain-containing protein n=1 Tax=Acaryochloris sp. IP29b_bin.137 TaxID=2969217 RepID=UPI00260F1D1E|nr:WD40 repeat domain-containing protein [Acaryochloris sp. IP29b_bin.137]